MCLVIACKGGPAALTNSHPKQMLRGERFLGSRMKTKPPPPFNRSDNRHFGACPWRYKDAEEQSCLWQGEGHRKGKVQSICISIPPCSLIMSHRGSRGPQSQLALFWRWVCKVTVFIEGPGQEQKWSKIPAACWSANLHSTMLM